MRGWLPGTVVWGLFFLIMGALFLGDVLGLLRLRPGHVWPLILIGIGAGILAGSTLREGDRAG